MAISSPTRPLKSVQRKLAAILLEVYGGRAPVHGFAAERSMKSNAASHVKRRFVFNIDLENFFPSVHFGRVQGLFASKPYSLPFLWLGAGAALLLRREFATRCPHFSDPFQPSVVRHK